MREETKGKKSKSGLLIALMVSGLFASVLLVSNFQDARAITPVLQQTLGCFQPGSGASFCRTGLSGTFANAGYLAIISINICCQAANETVTSVSDTHGDTFTQAITSPTNVWFNRYFTEAIWYGTLATTTPQKFTINYSSPNSVFVSVQVYANGLHNVLDTSRGECNLDAQNGTRKCPQLIQAAGAVEAPGSIDIAAGQSLFGLSNGAGFSNQGAIPNNCATAVGFGQYCSEYRISGTSGVTTFPMVCTTIPCAGWYIVGATFGIAGTTTTSTSSSGGAITVVACTWYQEECWLFPVMFLGLFSTIWIGIAAGSKVSTRGMTYVLMSSVTYGAVIEIMMGMLSSEILILVIVADVVYAIGFSVLF